MLLETKMWVLGVPVATGVLPLGTLILQSKETYVDIITNITYVTMYTCMPVCVYEYYLHLYKLNMHSY